MSTQESKAQANQLEENDTPLFGHEREIRGQSLKEEFENTGCLFLGNLWPGDIVVFGLGDSPDRDNDTLNRRIVAEMIDQSNIIFRVVDDVVIGSGLTNSEINIGSAKERGQIDKNIIRQGSCAAIDLEGQSFKSGSVVVLNEVYRELSLNGIDFLLK